MIATELRMRLEKFVRDAGINYVSLKYENSQVTICDSREKNVRRVVEADNFIRDIMRE